MPLFGLHVSYLFDDEIEDEHDDGNTDPDVTSDQTNVDERSVDADSEYFRPNFVRRFPKVGGMLADDPDDGVLVVGRVWCTSTKLRPHRAGVVRLSMLPCGLDSDVDDG